MYGMHTFISSIYFQIKLKDSRIHPHLYTLEYTQVKVAKENRLNKKQKLKTKMGFDEMMNFLGRVNSHLFGLRVVRCIQYKVSGLTTIIGSTMPGLSSVVDMGINLRTGFCQKLLAHTASHMAGAVGKVDTMAQGVTKYLVNHVAMTWRTTETDLGAPPEKPCYTRMTLLIFPLHPPKSDEVFFFAPPFFLKDWFIQLLMNSL